MTCAANGGLCFQNIPSLSINLEKSPTNASTEAPEKKRSLDLQLRSLAMAKKCVHKGCGKTYENEDEECVYHPGPPVFHEGQKGTYRILEAVS